jgi:6-phosphogluconolactonase
MRTGAMHPEIHISTGPDQLAVEAAERIIEFASEAARSRGRFSIALTGGSTPEKTYARLAEPEQAKRIDWSKTYVYLGDERFVPYDDSRSNFGMARRAMHSKLSLPPGNVLPIPTDLPTPADAAVQYTQTLATSFGVPYPGEPPSFDLVLLGLGDDGHVASLFPGKPTLNETRLWVTWSPPGTLPPPVDRVTVTYPVLNAARAVLFIVAGDKKAVAVHDVLEGHPGRDQRPAAGVRPASGRVTWMLDAAAARLLTRKT